jgi:hypothetical protein
VAAPLDFFFFFSFQMAAPFWGFSAHFTPLSQHI